MKKRIFVFVILITLFISCEDDEKESINNIHPTVESLILSRNSIDWFLIARPDSVIIQINGGKTPYSIFLPPAFSCSASILDSELIIIPNESSNSHFGNDSLVIMDSNNNKKTLKIEVKNHISAYLGFVKANVVVSGDTAFSRSMPKISRMEWNTNTKEVNIHVGDDSSAIQLIVKNVDSAANYPVFHMAFHTSSKPFSERITFIAKDDTQTITFTKLNADSMHFNFNIAAKDQWSNFNGNAIVSGDFVLGR